MSQGATLVLGHGFDAARVLGLIERAAAVTYTSGVPTTWQAIVDQLVHQPHALNTLNTGAAPVPPAMLEWFLAHGVDVYQGRGLTACAGFATCLRPYDPPRRLGSCGRSNLLCQARVVDEAGDDMPAEEATRSALHGAWLWTGDLATWDDVDYIYIVDRKNGIIIWGGLNVYPAQAEQALLGHRGLAKAAVVGVPADKWVSAS